MKRTIGGLVALGLTALIVVALYPGRNTNAPVEPATEAATPTGQPVRAGKASGRAGGETTATELPGARPPFVPRLARSDIPSPYRADDWPELPPPDAPLAAVFDTLADRARRGDAGAACRLVFDLGACRQALDSRLAIERGKDIAPTWPGVPTDNASQRRVLARCQGLGKQHFAAQYGMLKQTALAGHEPSLGYYLSGELFRRDAGAQIDFLEDFRSEAPRIYTAALQQGSPSAAALSGFVESGGPVPFLPEAVRHNAVERQSLVLLALEAMSTQDGMMSQARIDQMRAQARRQTTLTPEEFAVAERLAKERAQAWFADREAGRAMAEARAHFRASGNRRADPNQLCRSGYGRPIEDRPPPAWMQ